MAKERIEWIDISKGIGIILVIIGHCVYLGNYAHNWIFSFHMPLFFFLSGILFSKQNIVRIIKKKFRQLIVPYIVFCIIGFFIVILIPEWWTFTVKDIAREIYWGYPNSAGVSSIWFLICLFVVFFIFNVIVLLSEKNKGIAFFLFVVIVLFGFLLGRFPKLLAAFPAGRMPLDSDCACVALLFFCIGYIFKAHIFQTIAKYKESGWLSKWIILVCVLVISNIIAVANGTVNLHGIVYHNEILYVLGAVSGFMVIAFTSTLVQKCAIVSTLLMWFGRNSLYIMGTQAIVLRLYVLLINRITDSNYGLYFLPEKFAVIGCFAVTLLSSVAVWLFLYIKGKTIECKHHLKK